MKSSLITNLLSNILYFLLNIVFLTCRWRVENTDIFNQYLLSNKPVLICSWHSRFLFVARYFKDNPALYQKPELASIEDYEDWLQMRKRGKPRVSTGQMVGQTHNWKRGGHFGSKWDI